jgi:hypothetical protein
MYINNDEIQKQLIPPLLVMIAGAISALFTYLSGLDMAGQGVASSSIVILMALLTWGYHKITNSNLPEFTITPMENGHFQVKSPKFNGEFLTLAEAQSALISAGIIK